MIIEFSIQNYKSFQDLSTLQVQAANIQSKHSSIDQDHVFDTGKVKLLKSKAIYGANGSGKSNWIHAMNSFLNIIKNSVKDEAILHKHIDSFRLSKETLEQPSFFQIVVQIDDRLYRYGFEADKETIHNEWLFVKNKKEVPYFIREGQDILDYNKNSFSEIEIALKNKKHNALYRSNSLLLSVLKLLNAPLASLIWNALIQQISVFDGLDDSHLIANTLSALKNEPFKAKMLLFLQGFDDTIVDVKQTRIPIDSLPENVRKHLKNQDDNLGFISVLRKTIDGDLAEFALDEEEAQGTKKLFYLAQSVFFALDNGSTLIIDELNARLHPRLSRQFVSLFNSQIFNPKGAQLIFTTHDSNLLSSKLLRRDQIMFVEKNKYGRSKVIELVSFKGIRQNTTYERDYLAGKYGGVPFVNLFSRAFMS